MMKEKIKELARELGFDDCRITTAQPPASSPQFQQWLAREWHGEMGYLERNAHKRVEPQNVLAQAKSIVTLAVSYGEEGRVEGIGGQDLQNDRMDSSLPLQPSILLAIAHRQRHNTFRLCQHIL